MVTRNGRFQVSKGYSRESVKRDTELFLEEDFYRDQALRRLEERHVVLQELAAKRSTETEAARVEPVGRVAARPIAAEPREPVEIRPETREGEPGTSEPPPAASETRSRRPRPRRPRGREPRPRWWTRLWRRMLGR